MSPQQLTIEEDTVEITVVLWRNGAALLLADRQVYIPVDELKTLAGPVARENIDRWIAELRQDGGGTR